MMKKIIALIATLGLTIGLSTVFAGEGDLAKGVTTFKSKCAYCHSLIVQDKKISSATSGPDLTGIASVRPNEYLRIYMVNPDKGRKDFKDIYEKELKGKYNMKMPRIALSDADIDNIIATLK